MESVYFRGHSLVSQKKWIFNHAIMKSAKKKNKNHRINKIIQSLEITQMLKPEIIFILLKIPTESMVLKCLATLTPYFYCGCFPQEEERLIFVSLSPPSSSTHSFPVAVWLSPQVDAGVLGSDQLRSSRGNHLL